VTFEDGLRAAVCPDLRAAAAAHAEAIYFDIEDFGAVADDMEREWRRRGGSRLSDERHAAWADWISQTLHRAVSDYQATQAPARATLDRVTASVERFCILPRASAGVVSGYLSGLLGA
jgi:hypothetical protein